MDIVQKTTSTSLRFLLGMLFCLACIPAECLIAQSIDTSSEELEEATALLDKGDVNNAREKYREIVSTECSREGTPEVCFEANDYLILIALRVGELEQAGEIVRKQDRLVSEQLSDDPYFTSRMFMQRLYIADDKNDMDAAVSLADSLRRLANDDTIHAHARAIANNALGYYEDSMGNYDTAVDHYRDALELIRSLETGTKLKKLLYRVHNNMGVSLKLMGKLNAAKEQYEKSLEIVRDVHGDEHREISTAYNNLGSIYYSEGDIGRAAEYFLQVAETYQALYGHSHSDVGAALNNVAVSYFALENYDLAAKYFEEAQQIKETNLGVNHPETAIGYSNLASIQIQNSNYEAALDNYRRSISIRDEIYGDNHPNLIEPNIQIGNLYANFLDEKNKAVQHYEIALDISKDRLGDNHPKVSEILIQLGSSYLDEGLYGDAENQINQAFTLLYGDYEPAESRDTLMPVSNPVQMVDLLKQKARLHRERPSETPKKEKEMALESLEWAADLVDEMQRSYKNEASKLRLIDLNYRIYTDAVDIYYDLLQETGDESYLDQIFAVIEKSRSRIALELIQNVNAKTYAGVPEDILEEEASLNSEITNLQKALFQEQEKGRDADSTTIGELRELVFNKKRNLEQFTEGLESEYPSYYMLKYDQSFANIEDARALLGSDETLLAFMIGTERTYAMVVNREHSTIVDLGATDHIETLTNNLTEFVLSGDKKQFAEAAYKGYKTIIEPVEGYISDDKLLVVADQSLHYMPLEMLLTEPAEDQQFYKMPFLLRDYTVSYIPSVTVLQEMESRKSENPRNLLAVAPFTDDETPGDYVSDTAYAGSATPLLLTRYETRGISDIFRERRSWTEYIRPHQTELLMGADATMSRFSSLNHSNYNYIHFATHAFINEDKPQYSGMLLHPDGNGDGVAYVSDIYNMELNADLVVLGACETGRGSTVRGEGVIGFTRAFIYAGVSNLAVSLWRVNDQPTAHLMIEFYDQIRQGKTYSEALQQAKLELIKKPQYADPVNWAAFVLNGR